MAIQKIEEIYLYCSEHGDNSAENLQAISFMDHSGIAYTKLNYNDPSQWEEVLRSVNSWITPDQKEQGQLPMTKFPFITYTEVRDDVPVRSSPIRFLEGLEAIQTLPSILESVNVAA